MKIEDLTPPRLLAVGALGLAGLAAVAAAGFALGVAVGRDPEAAKRRARALAGSAARGLEQASLLAAQARERMGDLWAEVRAQAVNDVDAEDFARAAAAAAAAPAPGAATAGPASAGTAAAAANDAAAAAPSPKPRKRSRKAAQVTAHRD